MWDATEVVEFTRKHTASVHDGLAEIRRLIERLVTKRDERRDGFVNIIRRAMRESLCADAEDAVRTLTKNGIPRGLAAKATELARQTGRLTIFSVVDALTRMSQDLRYAGDRVEADARSAALLSLVD